MTTAVYEATFNSVWSKIQRGKEHLDTLQQYQEEIGQNNHLLAHVGHRYEPKTGQYVLYVSYVPPELPLMFTGASLFFGDSVHNFRSVLDHLIHELALSFKKGKLIHPEDTMFPITDSVSEWKEASKRHLREINPFFHTDIEQLQTYHQLDQSYTVGSSYFHPLKMLRDLDNTDKHRLLNVVMLPTGNIVNPTPFARAILVSGFMGDEAIKAGLLEARSVELGTEIGRASIPGPVIVPDVNLAGLIPPYIALAEGGNPILPLLWKLGGNVMNIVARFIELHRSYKTGK